MTTLAAVSHDGAPVQLKRLAGIKARRGRENLLRVNTKLPPSTK